MELERVKGGGAGKSLPYPYRPALGSRKIIYKSYQEQEKYHCNGNSDQHQSISSVHTAILNLHRNLSSY